MRAHFLLVLQYVVDAKFSYKSSCLMSLSRCSSKEDAATSEKKLKKKNTNSRWRGNSIDRLLHPSNPNHFETAANATL